MTQVFHLSPNGKWMRCAAQTADACPFKEGSGVHADKPGIAQRHGGVIGDTRRGEPQETIITPVVAGMYAVFAPNGDARTFDEQGNFISSDKRSNHLEEVILPKLFDKQLTQADELGLNKALRQKLLAPRDDQSKDGAYEQAVLPRIKFNDNNKPVVIRRAAPAVAGPAATPTTSSVSHTPKTPKPPTPQQLATAAAKAKAQAKAARRRKRKKTIKRTRTAIRAFKAYDRQLNKVAKVGGSGASVGSGGSGDWMDGLFSWFLDLFDLD
jgi:hypothetical protein